MRGASADKKREKRKRGRGRKSEKKGKIWKIGGEFWEAVDGRAVKNKGKLEEERAERGGDRGSFVGEPKRKEQS